MRFLVDECIGQAVARWLREGQGHEVFSVFDESRGAGDDEIIEKAFAENWILITNDKDFGEKVFKDRRPHKGIIFLRLENERTPNKIHALQRLLESHADHFTDRFVVVTEALVRFSGSA